MEDLEARASLILQEKETALTFIHSPFCATCHLAEKMLSVIEETMQKSVFYKCNASLNPDLMDHLQVESVPCLLITENGDVVEKIYAFHSIPHMYERVSKYVG
ncbi:thioredoxin family protein [Halobacillus litoralis]|uniref:thioredoxin family protein n=1 Tax=Halobacillus litoralis TaxID=45668 RepID=UPI001CD70A59|nr:thioredoxin family protein [Halobacillus litoralis]MCA0971738.1 thioredoxin family protein [Halobacillus litoralis]